ncbi:hypothetical protein [Streptomyces spectabilis]|uniref:Uncharacterized protein n=1 Tax=Streptomyces spectabilis TaxID=68270 RepID=A0A516RDN4_STRST|nr:hypothetical protein [Streptomyces spectabilis]QDQ13770.1 hypothetical protein FH965_27065 [Streptomyces spectabilis]
MHQWLHHMAGEEGKLSSFGDALGVRRARVLAGAVMVLTVGAALVWGQAVRRCFPARWWDHEHGVVVSVAVAGVAGALAGALCVAVVSDEMSFTPTDEVRGVRVSLRGRLGRAAAQWAAIASWALLMPVVLALGAVSRVAGWLEWAPEHTSYGVGAVVCFGCCVGIAASESTVAHGGGRSLLGCLVAPPVGWFLGVLTPEAESLPERVIFYAVIWGFGVLLLGLFDASGFSFTAGFGMFLVAAWPGTAGPGGGFWGGAGAGLIAFCVLGCLFLGAGSAERTWRGVGRVRRAVRLPTWLKMMLIPFTVGVAGEDLLGLAGVAGVAVVWVATCAGLVLGILLVWFVAGCLGRVPLRTDTFTAWAYHAGLLRIVGGDYQFRHSELHAWLVRNPRAPAP